MYMFNSREAFQEHKKFRHARDRAKCNKCQSTFATERTLAKHNEDYHDKYDGSLAGFESTSSASDLPASAKEYEEVNRKMQEIKEIFRTYYKAR